LYDVYGGKSDNGTCSFPSISVFPVTIFPALLPNCVHHTAVLVRKETDRIFGTFKEILFLILENVRQESV
jgi:hypothetical protein